MGYHAKDNLIPDPGYPPVLLRVADDTPPLRPTQLYLSLERRWVEIGHALDVEICFSGTSDWDAVAESHVDTVIARIEARQRPDPGGRRHWLVDTGAAPEIIIVDGDGRWYRAAVSTKGRTEIPLDDPIRQADRSRWSEMNAREAMVVAGCLGRGWD